MLTNKIKAALFDLDGTLVDSMWMWKAIDIEYLGRYQIELPEDLQQCIEGMSFTETACYMKERFQIPEDVETIKAVWNEMAHDKYAYEVPLKAGAYEFLKRLKQQGIRLAIATSNSRELAETVLKAHQILEWFDAIVTGCDVKAGKPAPDVYLTAAKFVGAEPEECLVFEDIPQGILAGKRAGMTVFAVEDSYSADLDKEKQRLADYYIKDYNGLVW